jgi:hypothetical protein
MIVLFPSTRHFRGVMNEASECIADTEVPWWVPISRDLTLFGRGFVVFSTSPSIPAEGNDIDLRYDGILLEHINGQVDRL